MSSFLPKITKSRQVVMFSSTAIALYGYDQGMMSLINTNYNYLHTMGLKGDDPMVGVIVSVYYLGCAVGSVIASAYADKSGRKKSIFLCLATASLGNALMFIAGLGWKTGALTVMLIGRVVMGLGVGGIDSVVPVYSAELSRDKNRGRALAQEFQANILGLNTAFAINMALTHSLSKSSEWAWRLPIILMQGYPLLLFSVIAMLPETPRWYITHGKEDSAKKALTSVFGGGDVSDTLNSLKEAHETESKSPVSYADMLRPSGSQFHPTMVTIMGQVNQALTGYGAVSVYGPQIFELLGFTVRDAEYLTLGNYLFYLLLMTAAWMLIDRLGRRFLMVSGSFSLSFSFLILCVLGGLAMNRDDLHIPLLATGIPGTIVLYLATGIFGISWLATAWLIPTEIYPSTARAQGAAISVIVWGLANFAVTLLTPIGFNNLKYWLFLVFAATNLFAGWWTWMYSPESGGRSFEDNQEFFIKAKEEGTWRVKKVEGGKYLKFHKAKKGDGERAPLLGAVRDRLEGIRERIVGDGEA